MSSRFRNRAWLGSAALIASAYAIITPPFQVPDEVAHYWRAEAAACGDLQPSMREGRPSALVPVASRDLVATLWVDTAGKQRVKVGTERLRRAAAIPFRRGDFARVPQVAYATILPYTPQTLALFVCNLFAVRPLIAFYIGRLINAWCALLLISAAPAGSRANLAIASLPMTLFLCGSYSPDALTIALAIYLTAAAAVRGGDYLASAAMALSKFYALVPLVALPRCRKKILLIAIVIAGAAVNAYVAGMHVFAARLDVRTNAPEQTQFLEHHPVSVARVIVVDSIEQAPRYAREMVGQLGWLDIPLPKVLTLLTVVALIALAIIDLGTVSIATRIAAAIITIVTFIVIALSQYLAWTPVGADHIEGVQGRYLLPLAPLALMAITALRPSGVARKYASIAIAALLLLLHAIAITRILHRYY